LSVSGSGPGSTTEGSGGGQATVVLALLVRPGHEQAFQHWQEDINRAVALLPGFRGIEVVAPAGAGDRWTIMYRFASLPQLEAWLSSADREKLVRDGAHHLGGPTSQHVLLSHVEGETVTVVISHPVRPEHETEFVAWHDRLTAAEREHAGFQGSQLYRPVSGIQENWTAVVRFDTAEHLDAWLGSPRRAALLDEGRHFRDFDLQRVSSPYGSWFSSVEEDGAGGPPQWKSALSVLVGLYPTVVLLTLGISALWKHGPLWATLLVGNVLSVTLLTWVVMPVVTRALRFWLAPAPDADPGRVNAIGAIASTGFLTVAALAFWLVTTQIWTLP
jgi:antibiotic biosynthesis monooxygenase (ABM) superfamily enzyme